MRNIFNTIKSIFIKDTDSSAIKRMTYNPFTRVMRITFHSGGTYRYHNTPYGTFVRVAYADSVGRAFHREVRSKLV